MCVCIRRFYCLYGDSMNVAARMSANAKESGVCVSPQIAAHLASTPASRPSLSAAVSLPRLPSFPSVCLGSERASQAAHRASAAPLTASDVPSEELAHAASPGHASPYAASEAHASSCTTRRLCVVSRGVHLILSHRFAYHLTHVARIASDLL